MQKRKVPEKSLINLSAVYANFEILKSVSQRSFLMMK